MGWAAREREKGRKATRLLAPLLLLLATPHGCMTATVAMIATSTHNVLDWGAMQGVWQVAGGVFTRGLDGDPGEALSALLKLGLVCRFCSPHVHHKAVGQRSGAAAAVGQPQVAAAQ
jgi:hypothetical protein